jgi:hypothetical protein
VVIHEFDASAVYIVSPSLRTLQDKAARNPESHSRLDKIMFTTILKNLKKTPTKPIHPVSHPIRKV